MALKPLSSTSLINDANLVGYWPLQSNSNDNKGSNNGTDTSVTYQSSPVPNGNFSQSANFTVAGSSKIILAAPSFTGAEDFTWMFLIYPTEVGTNEVPLGQDGFHSGDLSFDIYKDSYVHGRFTFEIDKQGTAGYPITSSTNYTANNWHSIVVTFDHSSTNMLLYQDGSQVASGTYDSGTGTAHSGLKFGGLPPDVFTNSNLLDIANFSRVLSSTEISEYWAGTLPSPGSPSLSPSSSVSPSFSPSSSKSASISPSASVSPSASHSPSASVSPSSSSSPSPPPVDEAVIFLVDGHVAVNIGGNVYLPL